MHTNNASNQKAGEDTTSGTSSTSRSDNVNLAAKTKYLELDESSSNDAISLDEQLFEEESSRCRDHPFDEDDASSSDKSSATSSNGGSMVSQGIENSSLDVDHADPSSSATTALHIQTSLVTSLGHLVQTPKESDVEGNAIKQVSKLLGEMAVLLDESISSSPQTTPTPTPSKYHQPRKEENMLAFDRPQVPVKLSLLRQMACINSDLHCGATLDGTGDGQSVLVDGNLLVETIALLLTERTVMMQEVLAVLEAAREETRTLGELRSRRGGSGRGLATT